ncbi:tyrosine-type recombinase/integrase [Photobacterium rosenbergii]|uniref:tyrosine-type recombinase/integrase n=1 Tax=Photobacterium rosenbergii TaxID=294936 RepID=UPI0021BDF04A|nr:tyrosine-type recombinase/integrase [Photobacterium rosenbergii]
MREVSPVKDLVVVGQVSRLLDKHYGRQMARIWDLGINLALRITDLLNLKFEDLITERGERYIVTREKKTGKTAKIKLNSKAADIVDAIRVEFPQHVYIFQSYRSPRVKNKPPAPLDRGNVRKAFAAIGDIVDVHLGTHSMRKTRGYHMYQQIGRIEPVQKMLRHSSPGVTLRYIGIEQSDVDRTFDELVL